MTNFKVLVLEAYFGTYPTSKIIEFEKEVSDNLKDGWTILNSGTTISTHWVHLVK